MEIRNPKRVARREVLVANQHRNLRVERKLLARIIGTLDSEFPILKIGEDAAAPVPAGELSLVFLTDEALAKLHGDFLDDPTDTDVITFEGDPAHGVAGEICVSVDTAERYAQEHRREFSDELLLYVVHGWLHLAGYDDLEPARKRVMRRAEGRALKLIQGKLGKVRPFALSKNAKTRKR